MSAVAGSGAGPCPKCGRTTSQDYGEVVCDGCEIEPGLCECPELRRSWQPADLGPVLDGTYEPPVPSVGAREDGEGLFYPGRLHAVAAEAEAGKTWFALAAVDAELRRGNACLFVDFEDDPGGVAGRLKSVNPKTDLIRDRFAYIRPEDPVTQYPGGHDLAEALGDLKPSLVVLDGVTEAMTLHGLELKDNTDVAKFGRLLPRRIADKGPAVVALDHVTKDREGRGGHAIGGVHKLNGLNGAMYLMENRAPFGIGRTGRSRVLIRKDRPGQLRRHAEPAHDGLFWYADLVLESREEGFSEVSLSPPAPRGGGPFRPPGIMAAISAALDGMPGGLSGRAIEGAVGGKRETVRWALETLISDGYVTVERKGNANIHTLAKRYPGA